MSDEKRKLILGCSGRLLNSQTSISVTSLSAEFSVYPLLRFYYSKRSFVIIPKDSNATERLFFDRTKPELTILKQSNLEPVPDEKDEESSVFDIHGLIGVLNFNGVHYLAVILERSFVCAIDDVEIFRIDEVGIFSIRPHVTTPPAIRRRNAAYIGLVKSLLEHRDFYFSYSMDITNTLSRKTSSTYPIDAPHYYRFDQRFFWNKLLVKPFVKKGCDKFVLALTRGCFQSQLVVKQGQTMEFFLFSRRSRHRAGTRYKTRGADKHGNVANYVETEQLIRIDGQWCSFIQTRGSIPLLWSQTGKSLSPAVKLHPDEEDNREVLTAHFEEQLKFYNCQLCVSLLELSGGESKLAHAYKTFVEAQRRPNLIFHAFDFHAETKGNKFDNAWSCVKNLEHILKDVGYHQLDAQGVINGTQTLVIRTNCLDCLDRTNVMQSFFAFYSLEKQLTRFGIKIEKNDLIDRVFKLVWANNGDYISRQYAGTSALKGDFTRTGKRDAKGVMKDGVNSLSRYYINNFRDQQRQAAIDLFLGKYNFTQVSESNAVSRAFCSFNPKQVQAIEACQSWIVEHAESGVTEAEPILGCWVVISYNKWGIEQERIFVVTSASYYRFKCDINKDGHVLRCTRVPLPEIESITSGTVADSPSKYAIGIHVQSSALRSASQTYQVYSALDFTQDLILDVLDTIVEAYAKLLGKRLPVSEEKVEIKKGQGSKIMNSLKIGLYSKGTPSSSSYSPPVNRGTAVRASEVLSSALQDTFSDDPRYYMPLTSNSSPKPAPSPSDPVYQTGPTPIIPLSTRPSPTASSPPPVISNSPSTLPSFEAKTRPRSMQIGRPTRPKNPLPDATPLEIKDEDQSSTPSSLVRHPIPETPQEGDEDEETEVDASMPTPPDSDDEWTLGTVKPRSTTSGRPKAQKVFEQLSVALNSSKSTYSVIDDSPRLIDPNPPETTGSILPPLASSPLPSTKLGENSTRWSALSQELESFQDDLVANLARDKSQFLRETGTQVTLIASAVSPEHAPSSPRSSPGHKINDMDMKLMASQDNVDEVSNRSRAASPSTSHRPKLVSITRSRSPPPREPSTAVPSSIESCATCEKSIAIGEGISALGKRFHGPCFICSNCNNPIAWPGQFLKREDKPYCMGCKDLLTSCAYCKLEIRGDAVRSTYGLFHPDCFTKLKQKVVERYKSSLQ